MSGDITGLVIARNEADQLEACLQSWAPAYDELVVVDDRSVDQTRRIASTFGAKVISATRSTADGFAGLRNSGLEVAADMATPFVLVFDADERPSDEILDSIRNAATKSRQTRADTAYRLQRRNSAFGGWLDHGRFSPDWQLRLFGSDVRYQGIIHEVPKLRPETSVYDLEGKVLHYTYKDLETYTKKMLSYAKEQAKQQGPPSLKEVIRLPLRNLIMSGGYKDGWRGAVMAAGDGFHEYMLRRHSKAHHRTKI